MRHKFNIVIVILILIFIPLLGYLYWQKNLPLISPIALIETMIGASPSSQSPKIIYGFFPYWNLKHANNLTIEPLTHFAYFAIDLNQDGTIKKNVRPGELEPGWNKLNSPETNKLLYQSKLLNQNTVITVTAMDTDTISSILSTEENINTAINSIINLYQTANFDSINIDFEYVGEPEKSTRDNFTYFISTLKKRCLESNQKCKIDIDIFGDTATKYRLWDLPALEPNVDHLIVMAYDYYRKTSKQAGPVAPLTGKCVSPEDTQCLENDVMYHLSLITKQFPAQKIILGIPFYGYEWQTASTNFLANTYSGTGSLATYGRIKSLFTDPNISSLSAEWSDKTLSPYLTFQIKKQTHQIHYENNESISYKIKLVNSAGLGGIAIWALGYETPNTDIWQSIKSLSRL